MTPEEIETIIRGVNSAVPDSPNNIPVYLLISLIPLAARFYKKYQEKSIQNVVDSSNEKFNKIIDQHSESMDQVIRSMAMYTEEIVAIHENHEELKEEVKQVKEKVNKHSNWIDKLKEKC